MQLRRIWGGVFLIAGTSIGGGMLGLPIVTAAGGIVYSSILLLMTWALMTVTALYTLEVNLTFPNHSNIITMVSGTLGRPGVLICWTIYILFLYSLLAMYISGGQDLLRGLASTIHINLPIWLSALVFVFVFGWIVMRGTRNVDRFNRFFMSLKLITLFILIILILMHVSLPSTEGHWRALAPAVTATVTSFGFSIIVPSLRTYFGSDIKVLRRVIILGSLLPLVCYIIWDAVIFAAIPLHGDHGLLAIMKSNQPLSGLLYSLNHIIHSEAAKTFSRIFTSVCVLTAFLCVSLGLSDYVADGVGQRKQGKGLFIVAAITFIPPLVCVILYPKAFIFFLGFAGLLCVILQAFMPALMAWRVRYHQQRELPYRVFGGRSLILLAMAGSIIVVIIALSQYAIGK